MRPILCLPWIVATFSLSTWIAADPATAPANAPVPVYQDPQSVPATVLLLPFTAPANQNYSWIGQGVQQTLLSDLSRGSRARLIAPYNTTPATDANDAIQRARDAGAAIVVFGQTQSIDSEIRLTGQVIDAVSGHVVGGLKTTGTIDQLFHMEDAIGAQTIALLPESLRVATTEPQETGGETPTATTGGYDTGAGYDNGGGYVTAGAAPSYSSDDSGNDGYGYAPYYGYGSYPYSYYPYYGGGFITVFSNHNHDDHHDHGDHGHDFHDMHNFHGGGGMFPQSAFHGSSGFSGSGFAPHGMSAAPRAGGFMGGMGGGGFHGGGFHGGGFGGHR